MQLTTRSILASITIFINNIIIVYCCYYQILLISPLISMQALQIHQSLCVPVVRHFHWKDCAMVMLNVQTVQMKLTCFVKVYMNLFLYTLMYIQCLHGVNNSNVCCLHASVNQLCQVYCTICLLVVHSKVGGN